MDNPTPFRGRDSHNDLIAPGASRDAWIAFTVCVIALCFVLTGIAAYELVRWLIHIL